MAVSVTLNSNTYPIPQVGDSAWGTSLTNYLVAISTSVLQKSGGAFTLTAEADFGANFGLRSLYLRTRAASPATTGEVRLGNAESIVWRNAANSANLPLTVNSSNVLQFGGNPVAVAALGSPNWVLQVDGAGTGVQYALLANSSIAPAAAIAVSKLASVTASRALVSDGSGFLSASAVTATELGLLSGRTTALVDTVATQTLTNKTLTTPGITYSTSATVTAGTNAQNQGALTNDINVVTTTAANPSGVTLPTATVGRRISVINRGTNPINVYPASGGAINGLGANNPISVPVNSQIDVGASSTTQWYSLGSVGGGLDPVERSTTLSPAVAGTMYLCDTTSAGFTITLPTGTAKASIGFSDARETWGTNNLTIAPASGQTIDGQAANETLVLDVSGSWVILTWDSVNSRWVIQSSAPGSSNQAIVQNGNTLGAAMTIGTNDNFGVDIETNGTTKLRLSSSSGLMTLNPLATGSGDFLIDSASSTTTAAGVYFRTAGSTRFLMISGQAYTAFGGGADTLNILNNVNATILSATQAGALTLGPSGFTGAHTVNGNLTVGVSNSPNGTFRAQSNAATASSTTPVIVSQYTVDTDCTAGYFFEARNTTGATIGRIEAASNTTVTYQTSSDSRLKQNPTTFEGLSKVLQMLPKEYEWASNPGKRDKGFYAQELHQVYPEAVSVGSDELTEGGDLKNPWAIDYGRLTPVLVQAIKELHAELQVLKSKIEGT